MSRMRTLVKPLAMVLAVPVLVTALGVLARSQWDARWTANLVRQLTVQRVRPDDRTLARYSLASLCADGRTAARIPPCRTYVVHSALIRASAVIGAAGFAFLGGLLLAAHFCRTSRRRMAWLFRPSLVFAATGTSLLAAGNGLLAVAGAAVGSTVLFGQPVERVSMSLVLVAGTAATVWAIAASTIAFSVIRRPTLTLVGRRAAPSAHEQLADEVKRVAEAVGAEPPHDIVLCLAPWVAVTDVKMTTLDGAVSGPTLCLSLPLCRILSIDELRALLAHELAHFSYEEAGYARRVAPFRTGVSRALERLSWQARGMRRLAIAPAATLLGFFLVAVDEGETPGAGREARADQAAVSVAGADALASALVKVHAFAPAWEAVVDAMAFAVHSRTQYVNASALFHEIVSSNAGPERLRGLGPQEQGHPTDRHPPLTQRLAAIGVDPARLAAAALVIAPASPAIGLVEDAEAIEQGLSAAEQRLIAETA
jgi:Zn-dependent protease with chaperone function